MRGKLQMMINGCRERSSSDGAGSSFYPVNFYQEWRHYKTPTGGHYEFWKVP